MSTVGGGNVYDGNPASSTGTSGEPSYELGPLSKATIHEVPP
jgi:hypothetical protein